MSESKFVCKHCGEPIGSYYSEIDEHMWVKHPDKMKRFLAKQRKKTAIKGE